MKRQLPSKNNNIALISQGIPQELRRMQAETLLTANTHEQCCGMCEILRRKTTKERQWQCKELIYSQNIFINES